MITHLWCAEYNALSCRVHWWWSGHEWVSYPIKAIDWSRVRVEVFDPFYVPAPMQVDNPLTTVHVGPAAPYPGAHDAPS